MTHFEQGWLLFLVGFLELVFTNKILNLILNIQKVNDDSNRAKAKIIIFLQSGAFLFFGLRIILNNIAHSK